MVYRWLGSTLRISVKALSWPWSVCGVKVVILLSGFLRILLDGMVEEAVVRRHDCICLRVDSLPACLLHMRRDSFRDEINTKRTPADDG